MRHNNIIGLVTLFILIAGFGFIMNLPPPARPNISIRLLGYTNDATGARLASFIISNQGPATAYLYNVHRLLQLDPQIPIDSSTPGARWHAMLDDGEAVPFTIPPPTNDSPWQLRLSADPDVGLLRDLHHLVNRTARRMPYSTAGDWITETPSNSVSIMSTVTNHIE